MQNIPILITVFWINSLHSNKFCNLMITIIPAVSKVDECIRAAAGNGANIVFLSHEVDPI
jgi:hypothetical protein